MVSYKHTHTHTHTHTNTHTHTHTHTLDNIWYKFIHSRCTFSCSKVYTVIGSAGYYLPRVRDMCSGFWWIFPRQVLDKPATRSPCLGNVVCLNNCIFSDDKMRPEIKLPAPGSSLFCRCLNNFHPTPLLNYKIMQFLQKQNSSSFTIL